MFKKRYFFAARFLLLIAFFIGLLGLNPATVVYASTLIVTNNNPSGTGSLRETINIATSGDTITFDPVLSGTTINFWGMDITKNIVIDATNLVLPVTLNGGGSNRIFQVSAGVTLEVKNMYLANGYYNGYGGTISNEGTLKFVDSIISNSTAKSFGAGIYNIGELILINSTFTNNHSIQANGGAIYNTGILTVTSSTFINNSSYYSCLDSCGGAIYNRGDLVITNSTFYTNSPSAVDTWGKATVINSTFSENGVYNITVNGNYSSGSNTSELHLFNTILANSSYRDCNNNGAATLTNMNNLIEIGNCGTPSISSDPNLDSLSDNGASTQTMALLPGSPAIDAGDDANCPATDQRGMIRPVGSHCDIGAYEFNPATHYVKWDASGANNGSSWGDAYTDLQSALSVAGNGDEIWVAAGTYKPGTLRTDSFQLKNGVAVYGGFSGTETLLSQRDWETNITILSGDLNGDDVGFTNNDENSYHVVVGSNTDTSATLDGFTVIGGNANGGTAQSQSRGGGFYNNLGSPTIQNTIFSDNYATFGGGMYNYGEQFEYTGKYFIPILTNVIFRNNSAEEGGGLRNEHYSSPILTSVTFEGNSVIRGGGGMENFDFCNPSLTDVTFVNNSAIASGGGMLNWNNNNPTLTNVTFIGNSAEWGGGLANHVSSPILTNVIFSGNIAISYGEYPPSGGGMFNSDSSSPSLTNVTFDNNSADYGGGIFVQTSSSPTLVNVTFAGNVATEAGGGMIIRDNLSNPVLTNVTFNNNSASIGAGAIDNAGNPVIKNTILWGNSGGEIVNSGPGIPNISYSVVQGGYAGGTNIITTDPKLGTLGNYGGFTDTIPLLAGSSAIDAGNDANCPATDQRGVTRPVGSHCDIGAFEADNFVILGSPSGTYTNWDYTFTWTGVTGATRYYFELLKADDTLVHRKWYSAASACTDLSCAITPPIGDLPNGDYKWRLLDYGSYGYGSWTGFSDFSLDEACYSLVTAVNIPAGGTITVPAQNCAGGYKAGTVIQLTATPNTGYIFSNWSGDVNDSSPTVSFTMDANKSVTANLRETSATLLLPLGTTNNWDHTFTWTGVTGATRYYFELLTADDTLVHRKWYDATSACTDLSCAITPPIGDLPNGDYKWRLLDYGPYGYGSWTGFSDFSLDEACYTLVTAVNIPAGGTITVPAQNCAGGYKSGTVIQLTAVPNTGYIFSNWSGDANGSSPTVSFTMDANKSVTANLRETSATLLLPLGTTNNWDHSFTWTGVTGATRYYFELLKADDTLVHRKWYNATSACTDLSCAITPPIGTLPNGDYKWRLLDYGSYGYGSWTGFSDFSLDEACYTLVTTVNIPTGGTITVPAQNCAGGYKAGTVVQLTATPNTGYIFSNWSGDANGISTTVSFTMDANKSVTANLRETSATLLLPVGTTNNWDHTFTWTGVTGATRYYFELLTADDTLVHRKWYDAVSACTDLSCAIIPSVGILPNGDYKWRLLDYGSYGYGSWTPYMNFTLQQ